MWDAFLGNVNVAMSEAAPAAAVRSERVRVGIIVSCNIGS